MHKSHDQHEEPKGERDYADLDIPVGTIAKLGVYIALFTILSFVGVKLLFRKFAADSAKEDQGKSAFVVERMLPPQPRLLIDEPRNWQEELAVEEAQISQYAWVDTNAGVVRIPIDRAIELVAERGLPVRPSAP